MTTNLSAAKLTHVVTAVNFVIGIEPGVGSTLKAIGSHMSGDLADARFGIIIESGEKVIIEIGIDGSRKVKEIVRDVQEAVLRSSSQANRESGTSESGSKSQPHVMVRIQSLF